MVALNYGNFLAAAGLQNTFSGPTLWVDPVNGNDALASEGIQFGVSPNHTAFQTLGGANAAAALLTQLSAPTFPGTIFTNPQSIGGHLAQSTTYYYEVTALNGCGETTVSAEQSYAVPATGVSTNQITINWICIQPG